MGIWVQLAIMVVSYIVIRAMAPKPEVPRPTALEDWDFPQVDEGTEQIVVFGDVWIESWMVLGYGNYRTRAIYSGGGKK